MHSPLGILIVIIGILLIAGIFTGQDELGRAYDEDRHYHTFSGATILKLAAVVIVAALGWQFVSTAGGGDNKPIYSIDELTENASPATAGATTATEEHHHRKLAK